MKKYISLALIIFLGTLLGSCKKEGDNIFNMFTDIKVEFNNTDPRNIVDTKTVKVGDEVWIDYTVTSPNADMYTMNLLEVGTSTPTKYSLDATQRREAKGVIKLKATARTGPISYRLYPTDKTGIYMGDGYKVLTVNVENDYNFTTERYVDIPNSVYTINTTTVTPEFPTVEAQAESFYSVTEAKAYSYTNGAANSAKIDCGVYYKPVLTKVSDNTYSVVPKYYMYAPGAAGASPLPFNQFDFTGWTAKGTLFSAVQTKAVFDGFKTGLALSDAAKKVTINLTNVEIASGSAYYFLTKDGKYGMILIANNGSDRKRKNYMNFWVKMQK